MRIKKYENGRLNFHCVKIVPVLISCSMVLRILFKTFLENALLLEHFNVIDRLITLIYNFLTSLPNLEPLSNKTACGIPLLQKRFTIADATELARLSGRT